MIVRARRLAPAAITALALFLPAQNKPEQNKPEQPPAEDPVQVADIAAFTQWLAQYKSGAVRLIKDNKTDDALLAQIDAQMATVAKWNTLPAARMLFDAARVEPTPRGAKSSVEAIDFYRELQPWKVHSLAAAHLRTMDGEGILPWLLGMLATPGIRAAKKNQDQLDAAAVLRVLAGHKSDEARIELLRACHTMPPELRVRAVNAMAKDASLELVPALIELLRDSEPNVRIAAANAIGEGLAPHVDETRGQQPTGTVLETRDVAIQKLEEILVRDKVWQARSAAAFALATLKCKPVVPALIRGLEAELSRQKDPWAMDVRLHKILEGLTGQNVVRGSIAPWKEFWKREGGSFTVAPATKPGEERRNPNKYEKFFNLEIESDRVLFVLDFSGSMAEPIELQSHVTGAPPGQKTTKAQIVVQELKKMVMSFPDGALLNIVVFSDDVRVWRQEGGRPSLVKLDDEARDDLLGSFLDSLRPAGPTNLYDALNKALDFGGRGLHDKYYDAGFDTLYVISDGAPTAGPVTDKDEIRRQVRECNQLRKLTINCVTFGDKNDTDFLKGMAEENGGRHIHVE
ncbi:MAG: HEAT repeat domain-containing protein [Planctomycetota bacterium]